ncbi:MAG: caspase family protein [Polyangiaceae bacterium]|nr:caspase family protein [Polyangiaceae bacterium]
MSDMSNVEPLARGDGIQNRFALVVGIDTYDDADITRLPYCVRDAKRLERALRARGYKVSCLHNDRGPGHQPTRGNVVRALKALVRAGDEDDLLLVHFSCHGTVIDHRPHLLLRDTTKTAAGRYDKTLSLSDLLQILRASPRWVSLFLDACHMGLGLDPDTALSTQYNHEKAGSFALLSGSTLGDITQDSGVQKGGVFTNALVEGLSGAAAAPNGRILFSDLARHVQHAVADWRQSEEGRSKLSTQLPVLRLEVADLEVAPALPFIPLVPGHEGPLEGTGLSNKIRSAAFTPDGRWLATTGEDCTVRLWSPVTGQLGATLLGHRGHVGGVAFEPSGVRMATASNDGTVKFWQVPGASLLTPLTPDLPARIHAVAWSPLGNRVAIGSDIGVHIYDPDAPTQHLFHLTAHEGPVWAVAFLPSGELLTGGNDEVVHVWKGDSFERSDSWKCKGPVWAIGVSPSGDKVVTAGCDREAREQLTHVPVLRRSSTGEVLKEMSGHKQAITSAAFSPDGKTIATTSYDGTLRLWLSSTGAPIGLLDAKSNSEAYAAAFSPGGKSLFVGFANGKGRLYDLTVNNG